MIQIRDKFSYLLFGFTILFRTFCILYSRQKKHKIPSNKIIIKLIFNAFWKEHFTTFAQEIFTSDARSSKRYKKRSCSGMCSNMTEIKIKDCPWRHVPLCCRRQDTLVTIFCWPLPSSPSNILEIMEGLINKYVSHWSCKSLNVIITRAQEQWDRPQRDSPNLLRVILAIEQTQSLEKIIKWPEILCVKTI